MEATNIRHVLTNPVREVRCPADLRRLARLQRAHDIGERTTDCRYRFTPRHLEAPRPERIGNTRHRFLEACFPLLLGWGQ
jgi:hypothetical protein